MADSQNIDAYCKTAAEVLGFYKVDEERGLTSKQVQDQFDIFGPNKLDEQKKKSLLALVLEQFEDKLVRILLLSALVSFVITVLDAEAQKEGWTAYVEPLVILTILILNAIVGVYQESNAEAALDALKKLAPDYAFVVRDGHWVQIGAEDLVPGDVVEVKVGDKIPADLRVIRLKTTTIRIEQSQLTGESQSVAKETEAIAESADMVIQGKTNMLFSSTTVSSGACRGIVVATGMATEIGKIQQSVTEAAEEEEQTPLQKKLDEFGGVLANLIGVICALVWIINYKHFFDPVHGSAFRGCIYYFKIAVALAVAAIPEGLPAVITTCLALGTRQMAKRHAIVRKLPSVETLGCTTVICSDKTGTLTTNEMCVVKFAVCSGNTMKEYAVEGHTYAPKGLVKDLNINWESDDVFKSFCQVGAMCNESRLLVDDDKKFVRNGEPTEAAIRVLVEKMGCPDKAINDRCFQKETRTKQDAMAFSDYWTKGLQKLAVLEFNRDRKSMSVLYKDPSNAHGNVLFVKGAPDVLIERCSKVHTKEGKIEDLNKDWRNAIDGQIGGMAADALRTIGLAVLRDLKKHNLHDYDGSESHPGHKVLADLTSFVNIEQDMTFLGVVGILDPPRPECKPAIQDCYRAGISVIMITGDNKTTAEAIAQNLGILSQQQKGVARDNSFTGKEFADLGESGQLETLRRIMEKRGTEGAVFSRTEPKHKQLIVKFLKQLDEIAAMTGDGVNDAPALKQADIGIAMGIAGTEVAKEASDMILQDDNFSSIVAAVEEGRSIYSNMQAFIRYMISSNVGEVASIFFTAALGIPEGLAPVQLLWVNLVTDGPPATALGFNPPDLDVMSKPPRRKDDKLISTWSYIRYAVVGFYVGVAVVGIFIYWYCFQTDNPDGHTTVTMGQLFNWGSCEGIFEGGRYNSKLDPERMWDKFEVRDYGDWKQAGKRCSYFTTGKVKASTLSLTVLVVIEMLNAFNALSEDGSLVNMPPWTNPYLIIAASVSVGIHVAILYLPFFAKIFVVCPLNLHDWLLVFYFSIPVIIIDEILKGCGRCHTRSKKNKEHQD